MSLYRGPGDCGFRQNTEGTSRIFGRAPMPDLRKGSFVMPLGLLGLKIGMTQVYDDKGSLAPVTVLQIGPCPVLQVRSKERDGYDAVQLGYLDKARRKATRPERGHVSGDLES